MTYAFSKQKLPKDYSYPLKRSYLDQALTAVDTSNLSGVNYVLGQGNHGIVLRASFCSIDRKGWAGAGRSALWIYAVPSSQRAAIESELKLQGLPAVISFLMKSSVQPGAWHYKDRFLTLSFSNGMLKISE
jgi:hypothetical protein